MVSGGQRGGAECVYLLSWVGGSQAEMSSALFSVDERFCVAFLCKSHVENSEKVLSCVGFDCLLTVCSGF